MAISFPDSEAWRDLLVEDFERYFRVIDPKSIKDSFVHLILNQKQRYVEGFET